MNNTYKSCYDLPLYNFIKLVVTNEMKWLYIKQPKLNIFKKKDDELRVIWEKIAKEYSSLSENKTANQTMFHYLKRLTLLDHKIFLIGHTVDFLSRNYEAADTNTIELIKILRSLGFRHKYTPETIYEDLKQTLASAKRVIIDRDIAEREYNSMAELESDKDIQEKDYYNLIGYLSKFLNFKIDVHKTSVIEYISYIAMYNSHAESLKTAK